MMASIPNMRSTPLPVPAAKTASAGDAASGGFAVQLSAPPVPGQPCMIAPPLDLLDGVTPSVLVPEGGEDTGDGEGTMPATGEKTATDDGEPDAAVLIPSAHYLPFAPGPQSLPVAVGTDTPPAETTGAEPVQLPCAPAGAGRKNARNPDLPEPPNADEAESGDIESAVKALLQRKPPTAKQVAALPKGARADPVSADPAAATVAPQHKQAPAASLPIPVAAPLPVADLPQPALSPAAAQSVPAAAEKTATVDGVRTADLATERKLDLARDGAWLDRLARDIARAASNDTPLRFRLHPQTLGSLHVELQQSDRGAAVRMTVDTEAARQILTDAQPRLAAEARAQGVRIAETHVDLSGSGRHAPGDQRRQDDARQSPLIRTAPGAGPDAATARSAGRARLDRYA